MLDFSKSEYSAVAKCLERLVKQGEIKKISKGNFYKAEQSILGELKPDEQEILKPFLFENGKRIAYITGIYLYNDPNT